MKEELVEQSGADWGGCGNLRVSAGVLATAVTTPMTYVSGSRPRLELLYHGSVLLLLSFALMLGLRYLLHPLASTGELFNAGLWHFAKAGVLVSLSALTFYRRLAAFASGRVLPISGFEWRVAFYVLVAHHAVFVLRFQPFNPDFLVFSSGIAAAFFSSVLLLQKPVGAWLEGILGGRRLLAALDVALFYGCFLLLAGELALRATSSIRPSVLLSRNMDDAGSRIDAARLEPGRLRRGFPLDSRGYYDSEASAPPREHPFVLSIGDSFSMGVVPHSHHFTTVAEGRLPGVEIYNMGVASIGLSEYLYLLQHEGLALEPDLVVIQFFMGNDLAIALPPADEVFARRWLSRDNILLYQVARRLARLRTASLEAETPAEAPRKALLSDQTAEEVARWIADPSLEPPTLTPGVFRRVEAGRARATEGLEDSELQRRFDVLQEIVEVAGETPVIFVLIPDEYQVEDDVWSLVDQDSGGLLERSGTHRRVMAWLESQGYRYLDLLPILRAQPPSSNGRLHLYHLRDTHFNARGNQVAGEALAEALAPLLGPV